MAYNIPAASVVFPEASSKKCSLLPPHPAVVVISGYANPVHRGHCDYCRLARQLAGPDGYVYFIVNSDAQSRLKKGFSFVPEDDRMAIMGALRDVDEAVLSIDEDRTVCTTIRMLCTDAAYATHRPTHFANGGDVTPDSPAPEAAVCWSHGIDMVYGLGDKVQSNSWILERSVKAAFGAMFGRR